MNKPGNNRDLIAYPFYWDDVPIDVSSAFGEETPAGKHGFMGVVDKKFVFEDGAEGRFWGTNFNSGLCFPPHSFSETISKRLRKIGINLVRFHQMDAEWATPNIFQFCKGQRKGNTLSLNADSMNRLDYLIHCLKREGIYVYMDLLTYRKFKTDDGIENALLLEDAARPYSNYDRKMIELQKQFCHDLWTHVNEYTDLAYKDDPAIIAVEVANESDMFLERRPVTVEPYRSELIDLYNTWRSERNHAPVGTDVDFLDRGEPMISFLRDVQESYYREMISCMREIGVRIPITGTNWAVNAANTRAQETTDYADGHTYWYNWQWREETKGVDNRPMVAAVENFLPTLTFSRLLDRPFFVSEWDCPWPSEWRADSTLFLAAVGAFQGWSGIAIHTYAYSADTDARVTGKEMSSRAIGSVPYREGVFTAWNDPAKFGLFFHAALLFRRMDVEPAKETVAISVDDMSATVGDAKALSLITEKHRVGMVFDGDEPSGGETYSWNKSIVETSAGEVLSDTEQLYRSWKRKLGWIDTERTKVVYGFLGAAGDISLTDAKFNVQTDYATLAISSLTNEAVAQSDNLLLTTVGRSENTGMRFNEDHSEMLDLGQPPILIETIVAEIRIATEVPNLRVWSISPEGFLAGVVPSEYENGVLTFSIGSVFKSMYYLIQAE